ncbi:hypothetical protein COCNU_10G000100 [Cocos nucifera]|uniref:Uncharacterized protein n=1 Tax=Cocos nucifera TaxID=13894 RepID=A0A8K0IKE4_COCNU|nr:hypothetical protein COCNU_10G000100 [Cocos nucifera]
MSIHGPDPPMDTSSIEVASDIEDRRKGIDDYRVARSLLKLIILLADVSNFEELIHHVDHFVEVIRKVQRLSKEAEEKADQATRRVNDTQLSWLKAEDENRMLKEKIKQLEIELSKARHDVKARLLVEKEEGEDLKEKIKKIFPDPNLGLLESDDEEAKDHEVQMEDLFNPTYEGQIVEDTTSTPPPAVIILPDQAEVGESGALDRA